MALEMGSAAHELFAAVRLWQLREYQKHVEIADFHGPRLFGNERYRAMLAAVNRETDPRQQSLDFCLTSLETAGFYDDPRDKRRTYTNLEEACIAYIDRWDWNRTEVWVRDKDNPESDIGIELPFDMVVEYDLEGGVTIAFRFTGKADGLHVKNGKVILHENKTASRLDDAWRQSFSMSSQVTGYMLALSLYAGEPIDEGEVFGLAVPLPRSFDYGGIVREPVSRQGFHFEDWFYWFLTTALIGEQFKDNPHGAPRYTHSCNRYFRPCALIPFCDSAKEEQVTMLEEMRHDEWSPLHEVKGDD